MVIIDGRAIAQEVLAKLQGQVSSHNLKLHLAAVLIGSDSALQKFVALKNKAAEEAGIAFSFYVLSEDMSQSEAEAEIARLSRDQNVSGVFIELPVPAHFDTQRLLNVIDTGKDVDVLSATQEDLFYKGGGHILPPAVLALKIVLEKHDISLKGKKVAVFGQGRLIGKPISYWLESQGAEVFRINENSANPATYSREAGIIVTGVGKPDLITKDMIKDGAVVIDFGYGLKGNKMVGDVSFSEVSQKASLITPVPGGMGPVVIAAVLKNLVQLSLMQNSDDGY